MVYAFIIPQGVLNGWLKKNPIVRLLQLTQYQSTNSITVLKIQEFLNIWFVLGLCLNDILEYDDEFRHCYWGLTPLTKATRCQVIDLGHVVKGIEYRIVSVI